MQLHSNMWLGTAALCTAVQLDLCAEFVQETSKILQLIYEGLWNEIVVNLLVTAYLQMLQQCFILSIILYRNFI